MYTLNWKQLEYFITLAEIQNYTKAASVLNITQPALSRAINNLEQSIERGFEYEYEHRLSAILI